MTLAASLRDYDPLLDKSYRDTALGPDVAAWLSWLELGGAAGRTLDAYERDLAKLALLFPTKPIDQLTDRELAHGLRTYPKPSRRTKGYAYRSFFKWGIRTRRITFNPTDLLPEIRRTPQRYIDVFTDTEVEDLTTLPLIDGTLMLVLIEAGLRKGEARALQVRRLKLDVGELVVVGGKGGKDRVIPLTHRLRDGLQELLLLERMEPKDYLWYSRPGGGRVQRAREAGESSFERWWTRCLEEAGVRYRNPHVARHTFATRWLRRGGRLETLSLVMGHASIATTFDLYGHLDTRDVTADLRALEETPEPAS